MSTVSTEFAQREQELGAIIRAYSDVTEKLKQSHERLTSEVSRLHSELARKNEELRRRERLAALGEMAAGVAHELRNPLGGIQVFASLLIRDLSDRPETQRLAQKISKGVDQLESIVSDILEFGRPSDAAPGEHQLEAIARETVEMASGKSADLETDVQIVNRLECSRIVTDGALLRRALLNLLLNAIEATASVKGAGSRRVEIVLQEAEVDRVSIRVIDQGPGIPDDVRERMFNPFFTTKDHGTGLGLAIVHQIAEMLGGSVHASNREPEGAVFMLSLPRTLEPTPRMDSRR